MSREPITPVVFRRWPCGYCVALFPTLPGTNCPSTCASYEHIGQHGSADPHAVVGQTKPAKRTDYADLSHELRRIGYRLKVCKRVTRAHYAARVAEIQKARGGAA